MPSPRRGSPSQTRRPGAGRAAQQLRPHGFSGPLRGASGATSMGESRKGLEALRAQRRLPDGAPWTDPLGNARHGPAGAQAPVSPTARLLPEMARTADDRARLRGRPPAVTPSPVPPCRALSAPVGRIDSMRRPFATRRSRVRAPSSPPTQASIQSGLASMRRSGSARSAQATASLLPEMAATFSQRKAPGPRQGRSRRMDDLRVARRRS